MYRFLHTRPSGRRVTGVPHRNICVLIFLVPIIAAGFIFFPCKLLPVDRILFREEFTTLDKWRPVYFPKIPAHTKYSVDASEGGILRAESKGSASALVYKQTFNIYEYPKARFRWKVEGIYPGAKADRKSGDDYAIRVYVVFQYNPESASMIDRIKYGIARKLYGEYPPHSTLNYVWANDAEQKRIITAPYTDKAKVIALRKGTRDLRLWLDEEVNMLQDYREAFGQDPPAIAGIAVMNDSDDTGQASVAFIDYIEIYHE